MGEMGRLMTPEELTDHIKKYGIRTITDALNYDKSLQGCPSGTKFAHLHSGVSYQKIGHISNTKSVQLLLNCPANAMLYNYVQHREPEG